MTPSSIACQYQNNAGKAQQADESLVLANAKLVKRIAHHMAARLPATVDVEDLIQAGMLGLIEAASNYCDGHGATFETYAGIRIRGAMLDELRRMDWTPRSVHRQVRELDDAIRRLGNRLGRVARDNEIAAEMGIDIDEYYRILSDSASSGLLSLDQMEYLEIGGTTKEPAEQVERENFRNAIAHAITSLPEREQLVLSLYYEQEMNLKEIGAVLGLKEARISQIRSKAMARLRGQLEEGQ